MPTTTHNPPNNRAAPRGPNRPTEVVDPAWLLRALALSIGAALLCAYITSCLLVYQGLWQLVLHPSRTADRTPATAGMAYTPVRFGDFETGQPHLTGWWIPAQDAELPGPSSRLSGLTVLYLHGGSGSLSDTLPDLGVLHSIGVNVFVIDYRGFGASDRSSHPDAERMRQDAQAALDYLVSTRHIPLGSIVPLGSGLGASLAVELAREHSDLPAVILENPDPDPAATAAAAATKLVPVRWMFGKRFQIAGPLASVSTSKLLIAGGANMGAAEEARIQALYREAASPKYTVTLPPGTSDAARREALRRFLEEPRQVSGLGG